MLFTFEALFTADETRHQTYIAYDIYMNVHTIAYEISDATKTCKHYTYIHNKLHIATFNIRMALCDTQHELHVYQTQIYTALFAQL